MSSLAATQSDGFYFPPNYDGRTMGGLSKFNTNGKYKGSNQYQQAGIIRFELPFDAWCLKCETHMSKGLRFNAKKDKAGKYLSTTIWAFTMKCNQCNHKLVIQTDPEHDTYAYVEGLRKHEQDYEPDFDDSVVRATTDEERVLLANDPMYRLQHGQEDKARAATAKERLDALIDMKDAHSSRDYDMNVLMRQANRDKKKRAHVLQLEGEARGLSIPLVEEDDGDRKRAKAAAFRSSSAAPHGHHSGFAVSERKKMAALQAESIFGNGSGGRGAGTSSSSSSSSGSRSSSSSKGGKSGCSSSSSGRHKAAVPMSSEARKVVAARSALLKGAALPVGINTSRLVVAKPSTSGGSGSDGAAAGRVEVKKAAAVKAPAAGGDAKSDVLSLIASYDDD